MKQQLNPSAWNPAEIQSLVDIFGNVAKFCLATGLRPNSVGEWINNKRKPSITSRWALDAIAERVEAC